MTTHDDILITEIRVNEMNKALYVLLFTEITRTFSSRQVKISVHYIICSLLQPNRLICNYKAMKNSYSASQEGKN